MRTELSENTAKMHLLLTGEAVHMLPFRYSIKNLGFSPSGIQGLYTPTLLLWYFTGVILSFLAGWFTFQGCPEITCWLYLQCLKKKIALLKHFECKVEVQSLVQRRGLSLTVDMECKGCNVFDTSFELFSLWLASDSFWALVTCE